MKRARRSRSGRARGSIEGDSDGTRTRTRRPRAGSADAFTSSFLRKFGVALIAAKFIIVPLAFDPSAFNAFSVPKALVGQMIGALLLGVILAILARDRHALTLQRPVLAAIGALVVTYGAASIVALDPSLALIGSPENGVGLLSLLDGVVLFVGVAVLVRTRSDAWTIGVALFAPVIAVLAYEVLQWTGNDPVRWALEVGTTRPFSTFGNANLLATYLGALGVGAAGLALLGGAVLTSPYRWALGLLAACALVGTLMTQTRSSLVGLALVALVGLPLLALRSRARLDARAIAAIALATIFASGLVLVSPVGQRLAGAATALARGEAMDAAFSNRLVLYGAALEQVRQRSLLGVGPDNFAAAYPTTRPEAAFAAFNTYAIESSTHSWPLKVATDAGILGLIAFLAAPIAAAIAARRQRAYPGVALPVLGALAYLLGTGLFVPNDAGTDWIYWAALGIVVAASRQRAEPDRVLPPVRHRRPPGGERANAISYLPLGLGLLAVLLLLPGLEGGRAAGESRALRREGSIEQAAAMGVRAISSVPYRAEYWQELGISYGAVGDHRKAEMAFAKAVELAPYRTTYITNLARAQMGLGSDGDPSKLEAALATARQAVANDPRNGDAYTTLAIVAQTANHPAEAVSANDHAFRLGSNATNATFCLLVGRAYLSLGEVADAERMFRLGMSRYMDEATWTLMELDLARALALLGRKDEALAEIDKVLAARPGHPAAQQLRLEIEQQ